MATEKKFVVLHHQVGPVHKRGDVVTAENLGVGDAKDLQRLVDVRAIRPANNFEAGLEKVTLEANVSPSALEEELTQAKDRASRLAAENAELRREIDGLKVVINAGKPVPGHPAGQESATKMAAEKDAVIRDLQHQVKALEANLAGKVKR